jgi:hypothetical protein
LRFENSDMIDRPLDEVRASWTDFFGAQRIRDNTMLGLRRTSPRPVGVESTRGAHQSAFGDLKRMLETSSP